MILCLLFVLNLSVCVSRWAHAKDNRFINFNWIWSSALFHHEETLLLTLFLLRISFQCPACYCDFYPGTVVPSGRGGRVQTASVSALYLTCVVRPRVSWQYLVQIPICCWLICLYRWHRLSGPPWCLTETGTGNGADSLLSTTLSSYCCYSSRLELWVHDFRQRWTKADFISSHWPSTADCD